MPARLDVLKQYTQSRKFVQVLDVAAVDVAALAPHIVASDQHPDKLYCNLTRRLITKSKTHVDAHLAGRRYRRALEQWTKRKEKGDGDDAPDNGATDAPGDDEELWMPNFSEDEDDLGNEKDEEEEEEDDDDEDESAEDGTEEGESEEDENEEDESEEDESEEDESEEEEVDAAPSAPVRARTTQHLKPAQATKRHGSNPSMIPGKATKKRQPPAPRDAPGKRSRHL